MLQSAAKSSHTKRRAPDPKPLISGGWVADLALRYERRRDRTILASRQHKGPLLVQRPFYPEPGGVCHTYVLHPPAGIVGGDDLRISLELERDAHALLTTPAATRWNFSRGIVAKSVQRAVLRPHAVLEWLPQETLLFDGAHARLTTRVELCCSARFVGWEIIGLGRPACGENFEQGAIDYRFELLRNGKPLILERLHATAACATLLATGAGDDALEQARRVLADVDAALCSATRIGDVLVCRGLAAHCQPLRIVFEGLWRALRPLLLERPAVVPRIWRT
jgi:urease accessory protein